MAFKMINLTLLETILIIYILLNWFLIIMFAILLEQQIKELELRIEKLEQDINLTIAELEKTK